METIVRFIEDAGMLYGQKMSKVEVLQVQIYKTIACSNFVFGSRWTKAVNL